MALQGSLGSVSQWSRAGQHGFSSGRMASVKNIHNISHDNLMEVFGYPARDYVLAGIRFFKAGTVRASAVTDMPHQERLANLIILRF